MKKPDVIFFCMLAFLIGSFILCALSSCELKKVDDDPLFLRHKKEEGVKAKIEIISRVHHDR